MRVFLDTNILLDIVGRREPLDTASQQVLERCDALDFDLGVAGHGLATVFYLTGRTAGRASALAVVHQLLSWADVAPLGDAEARAALGFGIADYEDALQAAAAASWEADVLITRDAIGFAGSPVPVLSPDEFLKRYPAPSEGNPGLQP
ncbi:MAG: PIN domain-containing protein [Verrucomicrobiales bacterium]|nr:PIN domain-containing protein [Verrucomicrobiales bacterium]